MQELKDWLTLIRSAGLGASKIRSLLAALGSPAAILNATKAQLKQTGLDAEVCEALGRVDGGQIAADLEWLSQDGHSLVHCQSGDFPPQLNELPGAPAALFCNGDASLLWLPQLAIVGTRSPTAGGARHAREFAAAAAATGLIITSGLALGVDGAAHAAALDRGAATIAVAGTGLDQVYPARHRDLAHRIAGHGLLVSELPLGAGPRRGNFPRRNRIISGLSLAVLVIEASVQSGSLITARLAAEQGREVYALPGSINNPLARGCHRLIKSGAKLVEDLDDLLEELGPMAARFARQRQLQLPQAAASAAVEPQPAQPYIEMDGDYQYLLQAVGYDPVSIDDLVKTTTLTAEAVSSMLLILELRGLVQGSPGGHYCRTGEEEE